MTTLRKLSLLAACLVMPGSALASGSCGSCEDGIELKFMIGEDINGSFSVTINGVTSEGTGTSNQEFTVSDPATTELKVDEVYEVTVDVGTDADNVNNKHSNYAVVIFMPQDACGVKFQVSSSGSSADEWEDITEATVHNNNGEASWSFGSSGLYPADDIKVRFVRIDDGDGGDEENSQSPPEITDPSSDFPTGPSGQPQGITGARMTSRVGLGNAKRFSGDETLRVSAGRFSLTGAVGDPSLADRENLKYIGLPDANVHVNKSGQIIDQVETGNLLAVAEDTAHGFSIKIFSAENYHEMAGNPGVFVVNQNAKPFRSLRYESVQAAAGHIGGIRIISECPNANILQIREVVATASGGQDWRETIYNSDMVALQVTEHQSIFTPTVDLSKWQRIDAVTVHRDGQPYSKTERYWIYQPWGISLEKVHNFMTPTEYEATVYHYYSNPASAYYGKIKGEMRPDGSWVEYVYHNYGRIHLGDVPGRLRYRYEPWLDSNPTSQPGTDTMLAEHHYAYHPATRSGVFSTFPAGITRSRAGVTVGMTEVQPTLAYSDSHAYMNASEKLTRSTHYHITSKWRNYPSMEVAADGSVTEISYGNYSYNPSTGIFTSDPNGGYVGIERRAGFFENGSVSFIPGKSTGTKTIRDAKGRIFLKNHSVYQGGTSWDVFSIETWEHNDTDGDGIPNQTIHHKDGLFMSETHKINELETHHLDQAGWKTITKSDPLGRTTSVRQVGGIGQADIVTSYDYDGRTTTITTAGGPHSVETSTTFDMLGRTTESIDENGLVTTRGYSVGSNGGRVVTTLRPDLSTVIESYHRDGRLKSVTGTGVVHKYYTYTVNSGGYIVTGERVGTDNSPRFVNSLKDWVGNTRFIARPAFSGFSLRVQLYNLKGQLTRVTESGFAPTIHEYDELGQLVRRGRDISGNSELVGASNDPITETITSILPSGGDWIRQAITRQWQEDGVDTATDVSIVSTVLNDPLGETVMIDANGNESTVTRAIQDGRVITSTRLPTSAHAVVSATERGRVVSENTPTVAKSTYYHYDDLRRLVTIIDPRGAGTHITYQPGTYRQHTVTPPVGPITEYVYVPQGEPGAGRIQSTITRDRNTSAEISRVTYEYNALGNRTAESGSGTYPVTYEFDPVFGEMTGMRTYRSESSGGDLTQWIYQASTGLLTRKQYADGNGTDYTYHISGLLHTRTWQRTDSGGSNRITTTYLYDLNGMPASVTYSDGITPPIDYQYNRAGRLTAVEDAAGLRTIDYRVDGQVTSETIGGSGLLAGYATSHTYNPADHGLRNAITVTHGSNTIVENSFQYCSVTGRLLNASQNGHTSTFAYLAHANHIAAITQSNASTPVLTHYTHRDLGGRILGVAARAGDTPGGQLLSSAAYEIDAKGRRTALTREDGNIWDFDYNSRDEVESGVKRNSSGNLLAGRQFHYDYDGMGNRTEMRYGGDGSGNGLRTVGYTPNQVNQYDAITHPGIAQILGHSPDPGPITATPDQQGATTVQGSLWRAEVKEANANNGAWADVEVTQEISGNPEVIDDGKLWIPHANAQPQYDLDGNLREDDRWIYTWNAENRLVSMTPTTQAITGGHPWMRLSFEYDYMGRRIHKMVETGSSSSPVVSVERLFLYDAWNLIAEIDATPSTPETFATYLWGPDVASHGTVGPASSMQRAGGVGGLLAVNLLSSVSPSSVFLPTYDGNGNIIAWVAGSGVSAGDVVERIDYDPFGRVLTRQGSVSDLAFGFSTKYTDDETGLCYYGYRWYDPYTGRWPSRDPIGERGGINLYVSVGNAPVNEIDFLGLAKTWKIFFDRATSTGPLPSYDDPFDGIDGNLSPSIISRWAWRQAVKSKRYARDKKLTVRANLRATGDSKQVVRNEAYDFVAIQGTPEAEFADFKLKRGFSQTVSLSMDPNHEGEINVTTSPQWKFEQGETLPLGVGPTLEEPIGVAGLTLVTHSNVRKRVTVKYRASAVITHDESAYPAHTGIYFTPENNDHIVWYAGGFQDDYDGAREHTSIQTRFISLTFVARCID